MAATRELGLAALQRGDFDAAISCLEQVQARSLDDCQTLLCLAGAYHQTKRDDDAVRVLSQVVRLQPNNAQAYYNFGVAVERLHRYEDARDALRRALALKPDYALAAAVLAKWEQAYLEPSIAERSVPERKVPEPCVSAPFIPEPTVPEPTVSAPGIGEPDAGSPSPVVDTTIPDSAPGEAVADAPLRRTRRTSKARRADRFEEDRFEEETPAGADAITPLPCDTSLPYNRIAIPGDLASLPCKDVGGEPAPSQAELSDAEPTRRRSPAPLKASRDWTPEAEALWRVLREGEREKKTRQALRLAAYSFIPWIGVLFGPMAISRAISARSRTAETSNAVGVNVANTAIVVVVVGITLSVIEWISLFIWLAHS